MECPECGFKGVLDNEKFCGKCGANILLDKHEKEIKEKTRIFGTIRNSKNRDPIQEASITLSIEGTQIASVSSNEQGEYEYTAEEDYTGQTLDFVIQKEGFIRKDISHEIDRFEIKSDFQMDEIEIKIKGKICDETDNPLSNASIRFSIGSSTIDLVSDKDGSFSFTIGQQFLNQTIGYEVNKEGFKVKSGKLKLLENLKCINISKSIPPTVPDKTWIKNAVVGIGLIGLIGLVIYLFIALPSGPGSIDITSTPSGASIYLDGSNKGITPKTISGVSAGSHTIKITKSGYEDYNTQVTVTAEEMMTVIAELVKQTGSIDVTSIPSGASFYLDGSYKGTAPKTISEVSTGSHTIKITKSGYEDYNEQVTVTAEETKTVIAELVKQTGSIDVTSTPSGADIYLDGSNKGTTPKTISKVSAGSHTIKVTAGGYEDYSKRVTVTAGETASIFVELEVGEIPLPRMVFIGSEQVEVRGNQFIRYYFSIENWAEYPAILFESAPDLPPCGLNTEASRTWVNFYDAENDKRISGNCGVSSPETLASFRGFGVMLGLTPPEVIYVELEDRREDKKYRSNEVKI